ncbi:MAG: rRNA pseudouridine synthase [Candidatus Izimaplasma sp.]|nr:rRNA pseudouridine synthase [Candidatus Izimaplasma bacterium]
MERLQKYIAHCGYTSRRKAEDLISAGKVKVNGDIITELGSKVTNDDVVEIAGKVLEKENKVYYVLYKPENYISTTDDEVGRDMVIDLIQTDKRIYPVGRLDFDTSGVLLMTNDGDFANKMINSKYNVEKEYRVKLDGFLRKKESRRLMRGVKIDNYETAPCIIKDVEYDTTQKRSYATIIITEGKYHQVKKMFEHVGHEVLKLKRVRFGCVDLKYLRTGQYRRLKPHERKKLIHLSQKEIQ